MQIHSEHHVFGRLNRGYSLSRFGDGEFKMIRAKSDIGMLQKHDKDLRSRLLRVFLDPLQDLLIGIPNPLCTRPYVGGFYEHFDTFISSKPAKTLSIFVSSFFTRPSLVNLDTERYFNRAKDIWKGREVVLVNFNPDLVSHFLFCDSVCDFIEIPRRNCFSEYGEIVASCYKFCGKDRLFLISAGPVASCLVYDLCGAGEQAIDIGQFALEYDLFKGAPSPEKWTSQNTYKNKRGYLRGVND